jgi:UDP-glucuronate 4-epimerase
MRFFITGGAGFIGSNLSERLTGEGAEVMAVDNFDPYYDPAVKRRNIEGLLSSGRFTLAEADIRDRTAMERSLGEFSPDVVVHLAARAGVRPSLLDPLVYQDVNMIGTNVLLEVSRQMGVKNFVFASSSSIYGNCVNVPFSEDDHTATPISPYGATKRGGEVLCETYRILYDMKIVCLRFFTVYGPRQRPDMAIHKFTRLIDGGDPIEVYASDNSARDYTYIDDILQGIRGSIDFVCEKKIPIFEVVNLGESRTVPLNELIALIEKNLGKRAKRIEKPRQPGDVLTTYANIDKARRLFGYDPKTPIERGIEEFVKWYKKNR